MLGYMLRAGYYATAEDLEKERAQVSSYDFSDEKHGRIKRIWNKLMLAIQIRP